MLRSKAFLPFAHQETTLTFSKDKSVKTPRKLRAHIPKSGKNRLEISILIFDKCLFWNSNNGFIDDGWRKNSKWSLIKHFFYFFFLQRIFWSRHIWESDFVFETKRFRNRSRKDSIVGWWRHQRSFRKQIHLNRTGPLWVSSRRWHAKKFQFSTICYDKRA